MRFTYASLPPCRRNPKRDQWNSGQQQICLVLSLQSDRLHQYQRQRGQGNSLTNVNIKISVQGFLEPSTHKYLYTYWLIVHFGMWQACNLF